MFTYQQNKSTECFTCVAQTFKALTQDPATARKIDDVRRLNACGQIAEAKKKKDSLPGCLFQTKEVLESVGEAKYNKGKLGHWRLQSQCILNGLVVHYPERGRAESGVYRGHQLQPHRQPENDGEAAGSDG